MCEAFAKFNWLVLHLQMLDFHINNPLNAHKQLWWDREFDLLLILKTNRICSGRRWTWREYAFANSLTQGEIIELNVKVIMTETMCLAENKMATLETLGFNLLVRLGVWFFSFFFSFFQSTWQQQQLGCTAALGVGRDIIPRGCRSQAGTHHAQGWLLQWQPALYHCRAKGCWTWWPFTSFGL